jgi:hypothetical protein
MYVWDDAERLFVEQGFCHIPVCYSTRAEHK